MRCLLLLLLIAHSLDAAEPVTAERIAHLQSGTSQALIYRAFWRLYHDDTAEPALRQALASDDWQQRQYVGSILALRNSTPDAALISVVMEGLRDDDTGTPRLDPSRPPLANAQSGTWWLLRHPEVPPDELEAALAGDEAQSRFLAAVILGHWGRGDLAEAICAICIPHLADNRLRGDALYAVIGLVGLGPDARPWLERAQVASTDVQQARLITVLLESLTNPGPNVIIPELSSWRRFPMLVQDDHWPIEMRGWHDFANRAPQPLIW